MNIYQAIADIMKNGCAIGKDKYNAQQKFKYRGIDDVMNTFQPLLAERGIFIVPEVMESSREERQSKNGGNLIYSILKVKYTFYAEDGSSISAIVIGEGMDSADKASNKAMAVAMKYAMFQVFCIPTEEMVDPDSETPPDSAPIRPVCYCEDCTQPIQPVKMKDGTVKDAQSWAAYTKGFFGKQLCKDCYRKAADAAKAAAQGKAADGT